MKILAIAALLNMLQLGMVAAPQEPIIIGTEQLTQATSLTVETPVDTHQKTMSVTLTAYSSTPDQTDDTPFLTAANTPVRDGVVAANFLPIGTKIQIPRLFGNKVFIVEDRMHPRFNDRIDIWFPNRELAKEFGLRKATVVVLES